ncbi:MAG: hypothetical protein ACXW3D_00535 [Caulobacteraceae bacterium]
MRYLFAIIAAMLAVACTKAETSGNLKKADADINQAADKAGDKLQDAYQDAKPELKEIGQNIKEGAKEVGGAAKRQIHEATAPDPDDAQPANSQ